MNMKKSAVVAAFATFVGLFAHATQVAGTDYYQVSCLDELVSAVDAASSGDIIRMKAGTFTVTAPVDLGTKGLTLSGGWNDDFTAQDADAVTTLDGAGESDIFTLKNAADSTVIFERFVFTRAGTRHAVKKAKSDGDLVFRDCTFKDNLVNGNYGGTGLQVHGNAKAGLTLENCVFDNNCATYNSNLTDPYKDDDYGVKGGLAVRLCACRLVTMTNCRFDCNGIPYGSDYSSQGRTRVGLGFWNEIWGAALLFCDAPVKMTGCSIRANRGSVSRCASGGGGIVCLYGSSDGSEFVNCAFVGNEEIAAENNPPCSRDGQGALLVSATAGNAVSVRSSTFAYNSSDTLNGSAALTVCSGAVTVRDSILYGNRRMESGVGGADLAVFANGSADVAYALFTENSNASVSSAAATGLVLGNGVIYGDPSFVTDLATTRALLRTDGSGSGARMWYDTDSVASVLAFDVHARAKFGYWRNDGSYVETDTVNSLALDAGDPTAPYVNETTPNGNRLNLGFYGNTAKASHSQSVMPTIAGMDVTFPRGYCRPKAVVTMGASGEGDYNADVTVVFRVGGDEVSETFSAVHPGAVLETSKGAYFEPGASLTVSVTAKVSGFADVVRSETMTVGGDYPPWYEHGGGANVVHVREGADGANDGSDWMNAYADIRQGLAALGGTKTELWVAGAFVLGGETATLNPDVDVAIRGGFTGVEDAADARAAGRTAKLSGARITDLITLDNANGVTFERIEFTQGKLHAVLKTGGAGSLAFDSCAFTDTVADSKYGGLALQAKGGGAATLVITNTLFAGNVTTSITTDPAKDDNYGEKGGTAVRICNFASVEIRDSTFVTNGIPYANGTGSALGYWNPVYGSTMLLQDAPLTMTGCAFRANRGATSRCSPTGGGIVYLYGNGDGSVVRNCLFVGNEEIGGGQDAEQSAAKYGYGALVVGLSDGQTAAIDNCTFAYNLSGTHLSAAGLTVHTGAATVRNSIFYGNRRYDNGEGGADLAVLDGGSAVVDYSRFTANAATSVSTANPARLTLRSGVSYGEPSFVTDLATAADPALLKKSANSAVGKYYYDQAKVEAVLAFDVHLKGKHGYWLNDGTYVPSGSVDSPAIDAGDPASPYQAEPSPNGRRVNLGCYGNTPWATMSPGGLIILFR